MRLLVAALLAVLVHAYWLFSNLGESNGGGADKVTKSVVISLGMGVRQAASGPRNAPGMGAEPGPSQREPTPVTTPTVVKEPKDEPTERNGPLDEDVAIGMEKKFEPEVQDQGSAAEAPILEPDDGPVTQVASETEVKRSEARRAPREARIRGKDSRSVTDHAKRPIAERTEAERQTALARSTEPQAGHHGPGDGVPDDLGKAQPHTGAPANRGTSATRAPKGVLREARPIYKRNPRPPYPRVARRRGYQGTVIVKALVGVDGLVNEVRLDESSGYETLDSAAVQTVQKWAFEPAVRGSETVEMWVKIPLRFALD